VDLAELQPVWTEGFGIHCRRNVIFLWMQRLGNPPPVVGGLAVPCCVSLEIVVGGLVSGSVIIEQVVGWAGLGWLLVQSIFQRDYPMVQGIVILAAFGYTMVNLLVDISYGLLNPRIRAQFSM